MEKVVYVGFGEYRVSGDPEAVLTALGLGSCVAVILYCPRNRVGGMVHVVLPHTDSRPVLNPAKFANTAVPLLLEETVKAGADPDRVTVRIAGGAEILKHYSPHEKLDIGRKNLDACRDVLRKLRLRLRGEATGGEKGRTVKLYVGTGRVTVKSMEGEKEI